MNNETRLNEILAICERNLALAERRTQEQWETDVKAKHPAIFTEEGDFIALDLDQHDASFIAACAGSAEAGWRSTIAAINGLRGIVTEFHGPSSAQHAKEILQSIIKAWEGIV